MPKAMCSVVSGVVEHASGIGNLQQGAFIENVATGVDMYNIQQPLGVCAGITPV